ncbi:hypothetical protein [Streptomyces sp. NPDC001980]|uniref:MmyB family transcriptional regulator n=1 Tax=Streptomyces sp. NPDC001980 TaxID=3157126 RepID=UPI0033301B6E
MKVLGLQAAGVVVGPGADEVAEGLGAALEPAVALAGAERAEPAQGGVQCALQLDEAERAHLDDLARTANTTRRPTRRRAAQPIRPSLQHLLDAMTEAPAFIRNGRLDILATNRLGRALYDPVFADPGRPVNLARYEFLDPGAADFLPHLEAQAARAVALLRTEAGRDPYNRDQIDRADEPRAQRSCGKGDDSTGNHLRGGAHDFSARLLGEVCGIAGDEELPRVSIRLRRAVNSAGLH